MIFIEIEVKTALIVHGFDAQNQEIIEEVNDPEYIKKIVAIERIQSISEKYILVSSSHERMMYWEYKGSMDELKKSFLLNGIVIV